MKRSRRYKEIASKIDKNDSYALNEAIAKAKEFASAKFDEALDVSLRLGVNPRHADQMIRGRVALPHGTGKSVRVLVLTKGSAVDEAKQAGADHVGLDDMIQKILEGWFEFDVVIATPDVMGMIGGKLGKVLGPKGMMPNPKSGTVTQDVGTAVREVKAGKIEFRVDRYGIIHVAIGKVSFDAEKLQDNFKAFFEAVLRMRPASVKGQYVRSITLSSTMGPGIKIDRTQILDEIKI
ncbi:50S ribosomal protein L1 [candidate division KSB1 bacterium]|nr:50S ribosomal protein L1 [candidate division KSB1 bacterium]